MKPIGRVALGSIAGGALAALIGSRLRPLFAPVEGGVGALTVMGYAKGFDYAVVALLALGAFAGGAVAALRVPRQPADWTAPEWPGRRKAVWGGALLVFLVMLVTHDGPHASLDPFHEGENLTPAFLFGQGERPYRDVFLLHGLAADGGLAALAFENPPTVGRMRRLQTVLDALTLALLVPIAAELTATTPALLLGVFTSLCGAAAFILPRTHYFRLLPLLLATAGLLRYARTGGVRPLFLAFASGTLGILWSLDTGTYALAGTVATFAAIRLLRLEAEPLRTPRVLICAAAAFLLPFVVLGAVGADPVRFLTDAFVIIPRSIDAVWSLPAPPPFTREGARYFFPPLFYGFVLAAGVLAWRTGRNREAARLLIVAGLSLVLFRNAVGRADPSHARYAVPMLGLLVVATVLVPLARSRARLVGLVCAIPLTILFFEMWPSVVMGWKLAASWSWRQSPPPWLVPYPFVQARPAHTTADDAAQLAALAAAVDRLGEGAILDFTNERVLYYLLQRRPPTRCFDIPMLSVPRLRREAMLQLRANPPVGVILGGEPKVARFDGLWNHERVPELAAWIDANYPGRTTIGRFVLATPR